MSSISDDIEKYLLREISLQNNLSINRGSLARQFNCVPSQINYVLSTRFTVDRGYIVESKRGGGGCVIVTKISDKKDAFMQKLISGSIGSSLSHLKAEHILNRLLNESLITEREYGLMLAAIGERVLSFSQTREEQRAEIFKNFILTLLKYGE